MSNFTSVSDITRAVINTAAGGTVEIVAAVSGKRIKVYAIFFTLASATTVNIKSASTTLTGDMTLSSFSLDPMMFGKNMFPWLQTAAGEALNFTFGGAVQCSGVVYYTTTDA